MKDDLPYLEYFANKNTVGAFMANVDVWGEDLTKYAGFYDAVNANMHKIVQGENLL